VTFTDPAANEFTGVPLDIPRHPTQAYEAIAEFIIFLILYWRIGRRHGDGAIISTYLMLYSTVRFAVEFVRFHEQGNPFGGPLDTSQWISIGLFLMGAGYWLAGRDKHFSQGSPRSGKDAKKC
jgi:phosphatidylglycerol:prolipoprotein diacylglycerol transferase